MVLSNSNNKNIVKHAKFSSFDFERDLLILGCGGHSKVVTEVAESIGFKNIYYEDPNIKDKEFLGRPVIKNLNKNYRDYFFIAIGNNYKREKIFDLFVRNHKLAEAITLIHPSAYISPSSSIQRGSLIMPNCVVNSYVKIGKFVIVNTASVIEHDSFLMDFSSIAPGVCLGGDVKIGKRSAISINSAVSNGISIGNDSVIGGSSLVLNDVKNNCLTFGIPAKFIREKVIDEEYF